MSNRKHVTLTLKQKYDILQCLDKGETTRAVGLKYGIGSTTVCDIKRNRKRILEYMKKNPNVPTKRKTMRNPRYPEVEKAVYKWYLEKAAKNVRVTGDMILTKATEVKLDMDGELVHFSPGWVDRFRARHGVISRRRKAPPDLDVRKELMELEARDGTIEIDSDDDQQSEPGPQPDPISETEDLEMDIPIAKIRRLEEMEAEENRDEMPSVNTPTAQMPVILTAVQTPTVQIPNIATVQPPTKISTVTIPKEEFPVPKIPTAQTPATKVPTVQIPTVQIPAKTPIVQSTTAEPVVIPIKEEAEMEPEVEIPVPEVKQEVVEQNPLELPQTRCENVRTETPLQSQKLVDLLQTRKEDHHDSFSKYISLLLKRLPESKALVVQSKVIQLITSEIIRHNSTQVSSTTK